MSGTRSLVVADDPPLAGLLGDAEGVNQVGQLTHQGSRLWFALLSGANSVDVSSGTATLSWNDAYI